jgi:HTH-type transcriptional regulator/antitoxin HipB
MKYTPAELGKLIKDTRTGMGLTQEMLAMTAGTGLRFIIDLEKGKPTCQIGKSLTVLNTLGIKMTLTSPVAEAGANSLRNGKSENGANA